MSGSFTVVRPPHSTEQQRVGHVQPGWCNKDLCRRPGARSAPLPELLTGLLLNIDSCFPITISVQVVL